MNQNTEIAVLGAPMHASPLRLAVDCNESICNFVPEAARVRFQAEINTGHDDPDLLFEKAGPRAKIFFEPARTRAAIVTCGGLCPGLNNVIRSAFLELHHNYGVPDVLGIRYGYQGLNPDTAAPPIKLTTDFVDDIHTDGGTALGSSRGQQPIGTMVDFLEREKINILLCVGGDGTQRGANAIAVEARKRGLPLAVVGVPKTIDNDICFVRQSFGYFTAIEKAREVLACAHNEAKGAPNGIGLVKLMGRDAGFIAAGATLASQEVNFTIIPEVPFRLEGEQGFLNVLRRRILTRQHAVIVVAEGAGQDLLAAGAAAFDASGNKLQKDIGTFLRDRILEYFREQKIPINMKYMEPGYFIRSVPADAEDSLLCDQFARQAVHAALAGKTDMLVGHWSSYFIHVPIAMAVAQKRNLNPARPMWNSVIAATGQPRQWE